MEDSSGISRNQSNQIVSQNGKQNRSNESGGSDDQEKISPRSLENLNAINSNLLQLVDDISSPKHDDNQTNEQIKGLNIGVTLQGSQIGFDHQILRDQNTIQNAQGTEFSAGTPFFPTFTQENQEKLQNQVSGVGDFQNSTVFPTRGTYSRQSSDGGECAFGGTTSSNNMYQNNSNNNRLDNSAIAVFNGPLSVNKFDDNYSNRSWFDSNSDYQEQIEKYGYIFQSPDLGAQRQNTQNKMTQNHQFGNFGQNSFQGIGQSQTSQYPQWEGYHHNNMIKQSQTIQNRASSFDKLAQANPSQHVFTQNEELETHSAASSGNHSAFSEGDIYANPQMTTPQQNYYAHQGFGGHQYVHSNQAQYGFTPNIQFTNSNQKYYPAPFQTYEQDELTPGGNQNHGDIQITDLDVNLQKFQIGVSPRRMSNEFKPNQKLMNNQQFSGQLNYEGLDKANSQSHQQYKTPSPYRNDPSMMTLNHNMMINQNMNAQKSYRPPQQNYNQYPDPYYPNNYGLQNQRMSQTGVYGGKPNYPMQRSSNIDQYTGNQHIGMNAPPMTRNLQFPPQDTHIIHGGPMIAIQQNMHQPYQPNMHLQTMNMAQNFHPPLRTFIANKQTGSQERDPSYQPLNFIPTQQTVQTKTVVNTPTHNTSLDHNKSVSSQNSNNSQQFSTAVNDQNEAFLFQLTKQYDECPNPQQKLDIIKGHVHKLALTQKGSRFLQKQVTKANSGIVAFFLDEISPYLCDLMIDNYGNYFCQSLLSSCSGDQRLSILRSIQPKFIEICCDRKGTHTIQTMFELVNLAEEEDFIRDALIGNVIRLSKDAQGTHVVQKVMASFPEQKRAFIFEEVFDQFIELAKNTNGLCVVKKLVQFTKNSEQAEILMKKIQENAIDLVQDPFGNYAVTEVIIKWEPEVCRPIFETLRNRISQLSSQKFSSNVIEKCLERADEQMRSGLIVELAFSERLTSLIRNQYGNYVVQKALKLALGQDKETLIAQIQKCIPDITDKKIREKWEKIIYDAQNGTNTASQSNVNDNTSTGSFHQDQEVSNVTAAQQQVSAGGNSTSHRQVTSASVGNKRANSSENNHNTAN